MIMLVRNTDESYNDDNCINVSDSSNKKLIIIGASGHGKVVADIAKLNRYDEILFLDDDESKKRIGRYPVVGTTKDIEQYIQNNYSFVVAIGNNEFRKKITEILDAKKARQVILIHPSAIIDESVHIGFGTVVMANVVINADVNIGKGCIINTASTIDHECQIDDFVHISPGAHLAGNVSVGENSWIGIGCNIINNITVTKNVIVGAGAIVIENINELGTYVGVPVRRVYK